MSEPTQQLLANLKSPVRVDVLLSREDLPAVVRKFKNSVNEFLYEAKEYGGGNLQFNFIDPYENVTDTAQIRAIEDSINSKYGLFPVLINAPEKVGDDLDVKKIIHGAVVHYEDKSVGVNFLKGAQSFGTEPEQLAALYNNIEASLEYNFASAVQKISSTEKATIGYALGHGEGWGYNVNDVVIFN